MSLCCQCGDGVEAQSWSCCCSSAFAGILPQKMCFHMSPQFHLFFSTTLQSSHQYYILYSAARKRDINALREYCNLSMREFLLLAASSFRSHDPPSADQNLQCREVTPLVARCGPIQSFSVLVFIFLFKVAPRNIPTSCSNIIRHEHFFHFRS